MREKKLKNKKNFIKQSITTSQFVSSKYLKNRVSHIIYYIHILICIYENIFRNYKTKRTLPNFILFFIFVEKINYQGTAVVINYFENFLYIIQCFINLDTNLKQSK